MSRSLDCEERKERAHRVDSSRCGRALWSRQRVQPTDRATKEAGRAAPLSEHSSFRYAAQSLLALLPGARAALSRATCCRRLVEGIVEQRKLRGRGHQPRQQPLGRGIWPKQRSDSVVIVPHGPALYPGGGRKEHLYIPLYPRRWGRRCQALPFRAAEVGALLCPVPDKSSQGSGAAASAQCPGRR